MNLQLLSANDKVKLHLLNNINKPCSLEEISKVVGIDPRTTRDIISKLAQELPIISLSIKGGYFIIDTNGSYDDIVHQINENNSRIQVLKRRTRPLKKLLKEIEKAKEN